MSTDGTTAETLREIIVGHGEGLILAMVRAKGDGRTADLDVYHACFGTLIHALRTKGAVDIVNELDAFCRGVGI